MLTLCQSPFGVPPSRNPGPARQAAESGPFPSFRPALPAASFAPRAERGDHGESGAGEAGWKKEKAGGMKPFPQTPSPFLLRILPDHRIGLRDLAIKILLPRLRLRRPKPPHQMMDMRAAPVMP